VPRNGTLPGDMGDAIELEEARDIGGAEYTGGAECTGGGLEAEDGEALGKSEANPIWIPLKKLNLKILQTQHPKPNQDHPHDI